MNDSICALATAPVNSSLALIRISGPNLKSSLKNIFTNYKNLKVRQACYGSIISGQKIIDDVILIFYQAPKSFTGEDLIEIVCHGNQLIVKKIFKLLGQQKIRAAEPGEFTKRAFLNKKVDLTQAEAINQIIKAKSEWEIKTALNQMHGSLNNFINDLKNKIILLKANLEASLDFIEEDLEFVSPQELLQAITEIKFLLTDLLSRCQLGEKISAGIKVAIVGKPNVGKSSLLNLMLNQERAIVSNIPGTTRDIIQEGIQLDGFQLTLLDTAGIHSSKDKIEKKGIELSLAQMDKAAIILMILDATSGITKQDLRIIEKISRQKVIFIINKIDLASPQKISQITKQNKKNILLSAKTGEGLDSLKKEIKAILKNKFVNPQNSFIADIRVINLINQSIQSTDQALKLISSNSPVEIITSELQELINIFSEITGEITSDDILDSIFSRFCIGK